MAGMASRMAGSPPITDSEENTDKKENNQEILFLNQPAVIGTSGTNIIKGIKDFYNLVDQSGLLTRIK